MFENLARNQYIPEETQDILFQGFPRGLNTRLKESMLTKEELAACKNFMFKPGGKVITRPAIIAVTDTAIGTPCDRKTGSLPSGQYVFSADTDGKVYYDVSDTPTLIGTVAAAPFLYPYKGAMLICDGSYLKYCDTTSEIKIAYDGGEGGTQYSNWDEDDLDVVDTGGVLVNTGIGARFTTLAWDAGYKMPITQVQFKAKGTTANAAINVVLRTTAGVLMAEKAVLREIGTTAAEYYSVTFSAADITTEMDLSTEYDILLEGTDFELHCSTVASGGTLYNNGTNDPTKNPIIKVHPGLAPKADFVGVSGKNSAARLFLHNPDEPGRAYYGNLTYLDWSTPNGGGWVGVIDDDQNSYKIGAFGFLYGTFYIYGTEANPYTAILAGEQPLDFSITPLFQHATATQKTLLNTNDDLWNASESGINHLKGVQESGDVRAHSITERISNKFATNWGPTAFAGYNPQLGHYLLQLPSYDRVLVGHTKLPFAEPGEAQRIGYPWSEFELPITPTYFSHFEEEFVIGASNGVFYKFDEDEFRDYTTNNIDFELKTASAVTPGIDIDLDQFQIFAASRTGAQLDYDILINGNDVTTALTDMITLPMSDLITVADLAGILVGDWIMSIGAEGTPLFYPINIYCFSVQIRIYNIILTGQAMDLDGFRLAFSEV
jgi:hypothetical protein